MPDTQWWKDYRNAFFHNINPLTTIGDQVSRNTERMTPPPSVATAPTPDVWWRTNKPHPMFPVPQQGPATDFGGMVIPNPDNVRVLPDTQSSAQPLSQGVVTADNFHGKAPLRTVGTGADSQQQDWFDQNAAKPTSAQASGSGDWFDANAPNAETGKQPSALSRLGNDFLSGLGITDDEGAKNFFEHPINTMMSSFKGQGELAMKAKDAYNRGDYKNAVIHGLNYLVPFIGQQTDKAGEQLEQGDYAGGIGRTLGAAVPIIAGSPEARAAAVKTSVAISDTAQAAASRAATAARNITPKQAAQTAGAASGAVAGHGTLSPVGAYYGAKTFGHIAEAVLGKERANTPIFQKGISLDQITDKLAETIAADRQQFDPTTSSSRTLPGQVSPEVITPKAAAPAQPIPSRTGLALPPAPQGAELATLRATRLPLGEELATPARSTAAGAKPETASAPRFTASDRAAAQSLLKDALKLHSADVVDAAVPGTNTAVKAQVEFYLKKGDVAGAEAALDQGAKAANPAWQPLDRQPVPSTNEIRARVQAEAKAPKPGTRADFEEDKQIQDVWRSQFQRHGWSAESEARREFIARNSTGMTKGELAKRFAATSGKGSPAADSASATTAASDDLSDVLRKSLDQVRAKQQGK